MPEFLQFMLVKDRQVVRINGSLVVIILQPFIYLDFSLNQISDHCRAVLVPIEVYLELCQISGERIA